MTSAYDLTVKASMLGSILPLKGHVHELVEAAGARIQCATYDRGERIYGESDTCQRVYGLHRGRVRTLRVTPQGKDVTLYLVEPGQLFGVDAMVDTGASVHQWGHDAEAMERNTVVVSLPEASFALVAARNPELMGRIMRSLWDQTQDLMDQAEARAFHDVRARVAHALLTVGVKEGVATGRGLLISPGMTHEELAALAGTRRESVTMALGELKREGILATEESERAIVILDVERLAEYREGGTSTRKAVEHILARMSEVERVQMRESRIAAVENSRERKRAAYQPWPLPGTKPQ